MSEKIDLERIPTGVEGIDKIIGGGIPRGFVIAVVGEPGTGKTIFCIHFIAKGLEIGEPGIYVTTEESRQSVIRQAKMFGFNFKRHVDEGRLVIIDALMGERGDPWSLSRLDVEELVSKIIEAKKYLGYGHTRVVIDSMSAFWLDKPAMARKYSYYVKRVLTKWDMTVLLVSQYAVTTSLGFGFGVEHVADGIIRFRKRIVGGRLKRFIIIEKMRQTPHDTRVYEIDVVDREGMVVLGPYKLTREEVSYPTSLLRKILSAEIKKELEFTNIEDTNEEN